MALVRLLFTLLALPCLLAPAAWGVPRADTEAATAGSGGALADPLRQGEAGGSVAPQPDAATAELDESPAQAQAAQEPTPTTPEGEQQPGEEQPGEEQPPTTETTPQADEGATAPQGEQPVAGAEGAGGGFLPSTGLQIAGLALLGLALLLVGVTLKPRRRVGAGARR